MQSLLHNEPRPSKGFWQALAGVLFVTSAAIGLYLFLVFPPDTHTRRVLRAAWQGVLVLGFFAAWIAARKRKRAETRARVIPWRQ